MAKGLAHWFWEQESISTLPHALVPVPSKTPSLRQRGFSPALQLAKTLSRLSGVPLHHHHQDRHLLQLVQKNQSRAQRRKAKGSDFFIRHKPPGHVAIVDDVMTTGGTVDALAQQLKKLGAKQVDVWVFARTPKQR